MVVYISTDTTLVKKNTTSVQCDFEKQFKRGLQLYAIKRKLVNYTLQKCSMDQLILYNNLVVRELILK